LFPKLLTAVGSGTLQQKIQEGGMKKKISPGYKRIGKSILVTMALVVGLPTGVASVQVCAADEKIINKEKGNPVPENTGFMKNPPKELTEKFPMCDAFLKVEWIDKEKKIGYSRYDLYKDGKKDGQMVVLIYLNQYYPHFDYDLNEYKRSGQLKAIFSFIREGTIVGDEVLLTIRQGNKKITFFPHTPEGVTFSDNRQNVCIPYPDSQLAWIVEGRQVGKVFNEEKILEIYKILEKTFPGMQISSFKKWNVFDLNGDTVEDYYPNDDWIVYSFAGQYFQMTKIDASYRYIKYSFAHSKKMCELKPRGLYYFTTDGKNYFLSNQCNLTELTKGGE
jgi:hypothetical protein